MIPVFIGLIILGIILLVLLLLLLYRQIHIAQVRDDCKIYGKASFETFLKEFNKRNWERQSMYPESFFGKDNNSNKIHASIIKFDDKGMIMKNTLEYWKFKKFIKKHCLKKESKEIKDLWES